MGKRILTAVVCAPILLGAMYLGGLYWLGLITLLILIGTFEFWRMMRNKGYEISLPAIYIGEIVMVGWILFTAYFLPAADSYWASIGANDMFGENLIAYWDSLGFAVAFLIVFFQSVFTFPNIKPWDIGLTFLALIYVGWTMCHLILLGNIDKVLLLYLFVAIWASDSGAYFTGMLCGRHKLAPNLSPKKTIEGAIGGVVCAIVLVWAVSMGLFAFEIVNVPFSVGKAIIFGGVIAVIGIVGDLAESLMKRMVDVKDSGNLLPGHGGILDRFDSIIMSAPFVYYLLLLGII